MRRAAALGLLFLAGLSAGCAPRPKAAVWVVRTALSDPAAVSAVRSEARRAGLDTLVVQVRGRGDAYYRSGLAPRAEALAEAPPDFDPLASVLAGPPARVLAWMNVFFLWSGEDPPRDPSHFVHRDGDWALRDADGRSVAEYSPLERSRGWIEGIYADPASEAYRAHFAELVGEVAARYPVAGVHLDFVRYPGPAYGQGGDLGETFRTAWGFDPRWISEELRVPDMAVWLDGTMPPADRVLATAALLWADLRASQVTALVRAARRALDGVRPGLELSAAVFPDAGPAYLEKGQDWRTWVGEGLVGALYPMAYFGGPERVEAQLREVAAAVRPVAPQVRLWAGLGAYRKGPEEIAREAAAAARLGYQGICLFDWEGLHRPGGSPRAYLDAIRGAGARAAPPPAPTAAPRLGEPGARALAACAERAVGGQWPGGGAPGTAVTRRWTEFEVARNGAIPRILERLGRGPVEVPGWVELRGVFRYVHPDDGAERRAAQRQTCVAARARVLAGEPLAVVAREVSQGGTREQGGELGRRFLRPGSPLNDLLLATPAGALTEVVEVSNGYWFYQVEARGSAQAARLPEVSWPARRILFREALSAALGRDERLAGGER